jgi:pyrroline-5-carboxylate reductase
MDAARITYDSMKLGFVGSGKMATALVSGAADSGVFAREDILVADTIPAVAEKLAAAAQVTAVATNLELVAQASVIVLCVKPNDALDALRSLGGAMTDKLIISIVAGLPLAALQEAAGRAARVVRVMPNTPALIHRGAAAYALGANVTLKDAEITEKLFGAVGTIVKVKEPLLDVVTGLSGSGPAYVYLVVEALSDAGVLMGLPRDLSLQLAAQTVAGAAQMVIETGRHPAALRDEVTSPGGTTIAGLEALEAGAVRSAFLSAVRAATERARELGAPK